MAEQSKQSQQTQRLQESQLNIDERYMGEALRLAEKGCGWANPNPLVGAVIVKDGEIIGSGYHRRYGELHAERNALAACRKPAAKATLYVTLEPCCHYGKTPPCTEAIIESGIARVVIGSADPNPLVAGKGAAVLREHGIEVTEGVLQEECDRINLPFFHYIQTKTPYVILKYAMTMDGKIAAASGKSQWITGEQARRRVHQDRWRYSAIMVGVGTVIADDPLLTCRVAVQSGEGADSIPGDDAGSPGSSVPQPVRIVCDSHLRTPLAARIVATAQQVKTIIATCCSDAGRRRAYEAAGCQVLTVAENDSGSVDLAALLLLLGQQGIDSLIIEGGAELNWAALKSGIVRRVQAYIAPKILGGVQAKSPVGGPGLSDPNQPFALGPPQITVLGEDILLESEVISCLPES